MRAASTPCTVGGKMQRSGRARTSRTLRPLVLSTPCSTNSCTISSMKNGVPSVFSRIVLEGL